ncbi:MAG: hypothetical protein KGY99_04510 [Phycisphaerae bacterium]|nr:hypothetical protein [Phycisphaerae bacterium]
MSLVNEALKRAEQDKRRHLAGMETPPPRTDAPKAPKPQRPTGMIIAAVLIAGAAGVSAYAFLRSDDGAPRQAAADADAPRHASRAEQARRAINQRLQEAKRRAARAVAEAQPDTPPPPAVPNRRPAQTEPLNLPEPDWSELPDLPADAFSPSAEDAGHTPRPSDNDSVTDEPDGQPNSETASDATESKTSGRNTDEPAATQRPSEPPDVPDADSGPDISQFTVNAILVGSSGPTAMVNGRMVRCGETIDGARVVEITRNRVTLEIAGRRHRLGM